MAHQKVMGLFEVFFTGIKNGMICAEGNQWKHRRKNISQAFNFDFIVSHIPMMVQIADKAFD